MKSLFIAGLLFFLGSIILIGFSYEKLHVDLNGIIVKMRIENLPASCAGPKHLYFVPFSYNGESYRKAIRGNFCEKHHIGEMMDIKWLKGSQYILWPEESVTTDMLYFLLIGIVGIILSLMQWKRMRRANQHK